MATFEETIVRLIDLAKSGSPADFQFMITCAERFISGEADATDARWRLLEAFRAQAPQTASADRMLGWFSGASDDLFIGAPTTRRT